MTGEILSGTVFHLSVSSFTLIECCHVGQLRSSAAVCRNSQRACHQLSGQSHYGRPGIKYTVPRV